MKELLATGWEEENCQKENIKTSWKSIHLNLSAKGRTTTEEIVLFQFTLLGRGSNTWDHRV